MKLINYSPTETVLSAVEKYVTFISPTYGPAGKSILLSNRAVDDGKIASQEFELENEHENHIISFIKETTAKTDERVGDGTTTSAILMSEIVRALLIPENEFAPTLNTHAEVVKLKKAAEEAVAQIKKASKDVKTQAELYAIAYNSFNNKEIAKLISETLFKIGKDGSLTVHDSHGMTTECEVSQGLEIEKGYVSPYLITQEDKAVLEEPKILVVAKKIDSFKELVPAIKALMDKNKRDFVVIAEGFGEETIASTVINKMKGVFNPILIEAPGFGDRKRDILEDIAVVVGAKLVDPKRGDNIEAVTYESFGSSKQVIASKDNTVVIGGEGKKATINERIAFIRSTTGDTKYDKERADERIAKLSGGVAVIRVGAATENEQKTVKAKVEDAVNATKAAYKGGIVKGAGITFKEIKTSSEVLNKALKAPRAVLEANGKEFLEKDVSDPTQVLIAALETAVSIATGLVEIGGIVSEKRKKEDK